MNPGARFKLNAIATAAAMGMGGMGGLATTQQAFAQSTAKPGETVEVVEVTAQGRKENPRKIPYNISAVSGADLTERHITDQNELLREMSGAAVVDRGPRNSGVISGVTLRGLNVNSASLGDYQTSAVPTVSTYVNQTPIFANFLIKDVERVEVLRGPQGTLYGSGSLGGTVRYITSQPSLKSRSGRFEATLGHTDGSSGLNKSSDLVLNTPLGESLALRFAGGLIRNAGVIDYRNVYPLDASGSPVAPSGLASTAASYEAKKDADTVAIDYARLSLLYAPTPGFKAVFTHQRQNDDIGGRRQPTVGLDGFGKPYGKYENGSVQLEPSSRKVQMSALELEVDLGFATLTSATSGSSQEGMSLSENTGYYAKNNWLKNFYYNYPRPMAQAVRSYSDDSTTQEVRLLSKKGGSWDYVVGAFYQKQSLGAAQMSYLKGIQAWCAATKCAGEFPNENDFKYTRDQKYKETSLYGELTYAFSPALRATGGLRRFDSKLGNTSQMGIPIWDAFNLFPTQTTTFEQAAKGTLYKGNLSYDLAGGQLLYGTISQGFRRGGSNAVPTTGNFAESRNFQQFSPDKDTNHEVGIKGVIGGVKYSVAAFLVDWKNIQLETTTPNWGFFAAQNGGRARSKGIETEFAGSIGGAWRYRLNYAYIDARLNEAVYSVADGTTLVAPAGARLPGSARNTFSAALDHSTSLNDDWVWTNRVNTYYQTSVENSLSQSVKFKQTWPGFSLWGASSSLQSDRWTISAYVKNIFNKSAVTGGFLEAHMGTDPTQHYFGNGSKVFIGEPRTIGVTVAVEF